MARAWVCPTLPQPTIAVRIRRDIGRYPYLNLYSK
jgi:hypothetical protein